MTQHINNHFSKRKITHLPDYTLFGMREELNYKRLENVKNLTAQLTDKSVFGLFYDKEDYFKTLNLFLASTQETRTIGFFIYRAIIPLLKKKKNFLDVGIGDGVLTKWICRAFNCGKLCDNHDGSIENFINKNKGLIAKKKITCYIGNIEDMPLEKDQFDLCVLSHVLYYIKESNWMPLIEKIYNSLSSDGYLLIVLSGNDKGKGELLQYFGDSYVHIDNLINKCLLAFGEAVSIYTSKDKIIALDNNTMCHIIGFLLLDKKITANKEQLQAYIDRFLKVGDYYQITTSQKFILIKK